MHEGSDARLPLIITRCVHGAQSIALAICRDSHKQSE